MIFTIAFCDSYAKIELFVPECFRFMSYPIPDKVYKALFNNIGWCTLLHKDGTVTEGQEAADELEAMIEAVTQPDAWKEYYPDLLLFEDTKKVKTAIRTLESNRKAWLRQKTKWKERLKKRFGTSDS